MAHVFVFQVAENNKKFFFLRWVFDSLLKGDLSYFVQVQFTFIFRTKPEVINLLKIENTNKKLINHKGTRMEKINTVFKRQT